MRAAAATTALLGACLLAGHALADTVPIPPLPTVTVPTLPVVVPPPTTPTLPPPTRPAPSPVQAPSSTPTVPAAPSISSPVVGSTLDRGSASSPSFTSATWGGPERTSVERFHPSRGWISTSGPKRRRVTTLTFMLPRAARVLFVVEQVSPV
jgi:hypothetical protein